MWEETWIILYTYSTYKFHLNIPFLCPLFYPCYLRFLKHVTPSRKAASRDADFCAAQCITINNVESLDRTRDMETE